MIDWQDSAERDSHDETYADRRRWMTMAEAAAYVGVSVDTIRRRLRKGELARRLVATKFGPTWEVLIDARIPESDQEAGMTLDSIYADVSRRIKTVPSQQETLAGRVRELTGELDQLIDADDRVADFFSDASSGKPRHDYAAHHKGRAEAYAYIQKRLLHLLSEAEK